MLYAAVGLLGVFAGLILNETLGTGRHMAACYMRLALLSNKVRQLHRVFEENRDVDLRSDTSLAPFKMMNDSRRIVSEMVAMIDSHIDQDCAEPQS